MKFCGNCGNKLDDNVNFCPLCGNPTRQTEHVNNNTNNSEAIVRSQGVGIIFAFMIISWALNILLIIVFFGIPYYCLMLGILPLLWKIPMTIYFANHLLRSKTKISIAFKICTLIFVSIIAGICMLCNKDI